MDSYWDISGLTARSILLGEDMASNVSSASNSSARLLEDRLRTLLVDLVNSAVGTFHRWPNVPFLQCMDVGLQSVAMVVGVPFQSPSYEFGIA